MKLLPLFLVFAIVIILPITLVAQTGKKAPDFSLKTADNKTITLSELKGKVVLVNFWATWCGPCVREIPEFLEVYEEYKDQGFEIVGVSLDRGGFKTVTPFVQKMKMTYPVVVGDFDLVQAYGGFQAIPTSFFVDKNGVVAEVHTGTMTKQTLLASLKKLL